MAGEGSKGWGGRIPNAPVQRIKSSYPEKLSLYTVSPAYVCQVWTAHEYWGRLINRTKTRCRK